jgi:hypothetical protein
MTKMTEDVSWAIDSTPRWRSRTCYTFSCVENLEVITRDHLNNRVGLWAKRADDGCAEVSGTCTITKPGAARSYYSLCSAGFADTPPPCIEDHASALYGREEEKQKSPSTPHHEGKTRRSPAHERYKRIVQSSAQGDKCRRGCDLVWLG